MLAVSRTDYAVRKSSLRKSETILVAHNGSNFFCKVSPLKQLGIIFFGGDPFLGHHETNIVHQPLLEGYLVWESSIAG